MRLASKMKKKMNKAEEKYLYPYIREWYENYLKSKFKSANITVFDTHNRVLSRFLQEEGLHIYFPLFDTYEIKVDLTGIIEHKKVFDLAFIEVKRKSVSLRDVGQLLGYCRVANPISAFLISPNWISTPLQNLILNYGRENILQYSNRKIKIAEWNSDSQSINYDKTLPRGL